MLYFVGAGLISGAVVHHPLDPARYTTVGIIGVGVFLVATLVNEFLLATDRPPFARALVVIGASLLLSFGIGMLSGGLQHFDDFPARGPPSFRWGSSSPSSPSSSRTRRPPLATSSARSGWSCCSSRAAATSV
ncbi:hypothetical protein V1460_21830 [Streptomyces sp. SCSIO 30461]|uniref:hypothetical protein n=1 Tax=Streptomyces sp. SCSIO 30461 TaxID=3118085 RepID=UPI0030CD8E84